MLLFCTATSGSLAQPDEQDRSLSPYFHIVGEDASTTAFPLKSTRAEADIVGMIASVKVTQEYQNLGKQPIEAIYVFPASTRAAVHALRMTIGERVVEARIRKTEDARQEYQQALQQGKTASLLEQKRPNVFQMNVGNIMPGDIIRVELSYTELLLSEEGRYSFVYPTVVGPRFANGSEGPLTPPADGWVINPYTPEGQAPLYDLDIRVNLNAGMPVSDLRCVSHATDVTWSGRDQASIALNASEKKGGNRDFILEYRLRGDQMQSGLLLHEGETGNYFLAMIQPPRRVKPEMVPLREYIFIVDVSGSMSGFPLEVSKGLLRDLIGGLGPMDRFNVILFASSDSYLAEHSVPGTPAHIQEALDLIDRQRGGGGTQLLPALRRALAMKTTEGYSRSFIIATDGYVTVEREAFELIRQNLGEANFFPFGIGSSVNRHLLEGMARVGKGESFVLTNAQSASEMADRFREYVQSPVLTDVVVRFEGFEAYDLEPSSIPDVLGERPVMLIGKWKGEPRGSLVLEGISGQGKYRYAIDVSAMRNTGRNNLALKYLWARERIRNLDDMAISGTESSENADEVTSLGLTYGLLTRFTSFLAVDSEVRNAAGNTQTVVQPLPLPQGVSNSATGNLVTAGSTPTFAPQGVYKSVQSTSVREEYVRKSPHIQPQSGDMTFEMATDKPDAQASAPETRGPVFVSGSTGWEVFLRSNYHYPDALKVTGISGIIVIEFMVDGLGRVSDLRVVQGLHPDLDEEALRVVRLSSGKWRPALKYGKPVGQRHTLTLEVSPRMRGK